MNDSQFNQRVDLTLRAIEDAVDRSGADIDYDQQGGVLTLEFDSGAKLIFSRQLPVRQLWLAAPSGGFHFNLVAENWCLADGQDLCSFVNRLATELAGEPLNLEF